MTRCLTIADIGANHDGEIDRALALICLAAQSGADVVKYQMFSADTIVSREGFAALPKMAHQQAWDRDVVDVYRDAEVPRAWLPHLVAQCQESGVEFMCTPYSLQAVEVLDPFVKRWKIGSGDITYRDIQRRVAITDKPVLLATGASDFQEVLPAINAILSSGSGGLTIMQCNTDYSGCGAARTNLKWMSEFRRGWLGHGVSSYPGYVAGVGLSDHTRSLPVVLGAVALGASVIERHFTDDASRKGPDHSFAMNPIQWREMVDAIRELESALGDGIKKVEPNEVEARIVQRRCWRLTRDVKAGETLAASDIIALRPCPDGALTPMDRVTGLTMLVDAIKGDALQRITTGHLIPCPVPAKPIGNYNDNVGAPCVDYSGAA